MKKLLSACLVMITVLCFSTQSMAQDSTAWAKKTPEEMAQALTKRMKSKLNLTADQEPKVNDINLAFAKKASALKGSGASKISKLQSLKKYQDDKDNALKGVLNDKQFATYQQMEEAQKEKIKEKMAAKKNNQ